MGDLLVTGGWAGNLPGRLRDAPTVPAPGPRRHEPDAGVRLP
ncbi:MULTISPECIES: hypothetical protein [unclassified Actinomyces]|nr:MULTISPECIES: hypothetical protein [unclassified Actinomyces]